MIMKTAKTAAGEALSPVNINDLEDPTFRAVRLASVLYRLLDGSISGPYQEVLENWQTPAEDFSTTYEALTLAIDFHEMGGSEVIPAMMRAVKDYLQREAKRRQSEDVSPALLAAIVEAELTHAAWMALGKDGELPDDAPEERAFDVAEREVINFPCQTIHDVRGKVAWLMARDLKSAGPTARGSVQTNYFSDFMNSLLGLSAGKGA